MVGRNSGLLVAFGEGESLSLSSEEPRRVFLACSAAKVFVLSLLEARSCVSSDGTGEVVSDARCVPLGEQAAGS